MKALTIRQPWASLIAAGVKTIETRSRRTHHRGLVAIHAGMHRPTEGEDVGDWWWNDSAADPECIVQQSSMGARIHPAPLGAIVAVAELVDSVPMTDCWPENDGRHLLINGGTLKLYQGHPNDEPYKSDDVSDQLPFGDFAVDRVAWLLADIHPLAEPVECRGAQGLWNLPADVEAAVLAQLNEEVAS